MNAPGSIASADAPFLRRRNAKPTISAASAAPIATAAPVLNGACGAAACAGALTLGAAAGIDAAGAADAGVALAADPAAASDAMVSEAVVAAAVADAAAPAAALACGFCALPAAGAGATFAAGLPMPCFCNSINTRFFSASNCCRLDGRACEAPAACAPEPDGARFAAPGASNASAPAADAPFAPAGAC
ncbi:Uncharacterised protein [Burkholderia pseudomallei]|nr:hypothetical protein X942_4075 [Burkholderia pseudomallei MSHR5596]CAJ4565965.1 Uncharacterised protein [Burkholderia pseudomallei]CAJ5901422.1 Uncharacterised protein [Burkholderia pseudomallei]CAK0608055.1 Uncharacterised protein [Burkholderia pseudomallei]